jgi:hypothetical protein
MSKQKNCKDCDPCQDQTIKTGAHNLPECNEPNPCTHFVDARCVLLQDGQSITTMLPQISQITTDSAEVEVVLAQIPLPPNSAGQVNITIVGKRGAETLLSELTFLYNNTLPAVYISPNYTLDVDDTMPTSMFSDIIPTDFYATPSQNSFTIFVLPDSADETIWTVTYNTVIASEQP